MKNLRRLDAILILIAILLTSAVSVAWAEKAPVEGKKYADSDIPAASKPRIWASGWTTKEKVTVQKQKSADKSADDVKLTCKPSNAKTGAPCKDFHKVSAGSKYQPSRKATFNRVLKFKKPHPKTRPAEKKKNRRFY